MTGRDGTKGKNRRRMAVVGGAVGGFVAAAAMATGSVVTAASAKADIDTLLDPIIQPLVTSLSDAIAGFDPAAATDLTSWTDSLLASLNSLDIGAALPSAAEPAAAAASSTSAAASGPVDIPLTMQEVTEPTVNVSVEGGSSLPMLVDTGSAGLVIPWQDVGPFGLGLFSLGFPTGIAESGYSGGVDYLYLEYNDATLNYGDGLLTTSHSPIDVEVLSWPTSLTGPSSFDQFLADDHVNGVLGIGDGIGPSFQGPLQAAGFSGVTVDIPQNELVVGANAGTPIAGGTISDATNGAPITSLYESVNHGTATQVLDDVDSGGVYGTIPQSLVGNAGSVPPGTTIDVYNHPGGNLLYSYTTGTDSLGNSTSPTVTTGTALDSGVEPYLKEPIYLNYTNNSLTFDDPLS